MLTTIDRRIQSMSQDFSVSKVVGLSEEEEMHEILLVDNFKDKLPVGKSYHKEDWTTSSWKYVPVKVEYAWIIIQTNYEDKEVELPLRGSIILEFWTTDFLNLKCRKKCSCVNCIQLSVSMCIFRYIQLMGSNGQHENQRVDPSWIKG